MELKKGNSVRVKAGVLEPDTEEFEIGGWQGRIVEIDTTSTDEGTLVSIEWDSATLQLLPAEYIIQSEIDGLGWEMMVLYEEDIEKAEPRDKESDVIKMQDELSEKYYWSSLGEDGVRIAAVLGTASRTDNMKCFDIWYKHLERSLSFPFKAIVSESEDYGSIQVGEAVVIHSLSTINDRVGINATVKLNNEYQEFPLCDLDASDNRSANYQLLYDYGIWFANR